MSRNLQQQQQQQMQQLRQRQMGGAWLEQQKRKAAQAAANDPYLQLEHLVDTLRKEYAAKRVTKEQAEAELREHMIEDARGVRWMVGFETGKWYRLENGAWVPAQRPVGLVSPVAPVWAEEPRSRPVLGFLAFLFGLLLTAAAGFIAAYIVYEILGIRDGADLPAAIIVWGIGFLLSVRWGRRVGRGR